MKQRTTGKQLDELSEKGYKTLEDWTIKKGYAVYTEPESGGQGYQFELAEDLKSWRARPLLTIGQMIEFLDEAWNLPNFWTIESIGHNKGIPHTWNIAISGLMGDDDDYKGVSEELCDALWKPVKEALEK